MLISSSAFSGEQCYLSASNYEDVFWDSEVDDIVPLGEEVVITESWEECKALAVKIAKNNIIDSDGEKLWDDSSVIFAFWVKHLVINWEYDDAYALSPFSSNTNGLVNIYTEKCEKAQGLNLEGERSFFSNCRSTESRN
jgi:hypothetical protein